MEKRDFALDLVDFIYESPTSFHAVFEMEKILKENGFKELRESDSWKLELEGKYYVKKNHSALVAFKVNSEDVENEGFKIVGSHTDAPSIRIKPCPEMKEANYLKLNCEIYGGPILNTWLDRPLSLAGRVIFKTDDPMNPSQELVNIRRPIMLIPNLAIHMNRNINEGVALNKQKDMLPILGLLEDESELKDVLKEIIAEEIIGDKEDIYDFELFLYEYDKGRLVGINEEFISAGKLDNLGMVHSSLYGFLEAEKGTGISVLAAFDNEEVGSMTKQGADSPLLANILERITISLNKDREDYFRALKNSFIISADQAHGVHPNSPEKTDPTNKPYLNKGPVIKISANQSYTSDAKSTAVFQGICEKASVAYQKFVNRSDERGGSTIGPISSSHLPINSVDVGNPILGMHSIRETGGVNDHYDMKEAIKVFYSL